MIVLIYYVTKDIASYKKKILVYYWFWVWLSVLEIEKTWSTRFIFLSFSLSLPLLCLIKRRANLNPLHSHHHSRRLCSVSSVVSRARGAHAALASYRNSQCGVHISLPHRPVIIPLSLYLSLSLPLSPMGLQSVCVASLYHALCTTTLQPSSISPLASCMATRMNVLCFAL
jgi:hypothetical protein